MATRVAAAGAGLMQALVFDGDTLAVRTCAVPRPADDEALVRVRQAGVCSTDLEIVRGYGQHRGILGHEMVGQVETAADPAWIGRRVAVEINVACGRCDRCRAGHATHCATRSVMGIARRDGCFAEMVAMPIRNLHAVPDAIDDDAAVFTEPLAAAFAIVQDVEIRADDRVLVLGDGKLGTLVAMVLHDHGCRLVHAGRHAEKLALTGGLGVRTEMVSALADRDFDVVVEATGSREGLGEALARCRPRGTIVLKTTVADPAPLFTTRIVVDEIRVVGSRCGPFAIALDALAEGRIDPRPLIVARYPLSRAPEAFAHAAQRGALKVMLTP